MRQNSEATEQESEEKMDKQAKRTATMSRKSCLFSFAVIIMIILLYWEDKEQKIENDRDRI